MISVPRIAPDLAPLEFRFLGDGRNERYRVSDSYCDDPDCPEHESCVDLTRIDKPGVELRVWVDLADCQARWDADLCQARLAVARAFVRDHTMLRALKRRRQLARAWGLSRQDVALHARREASGRLCSLSGLDALGEQHVVPFVAGGQTWTVVDQHCVAPDCTCMHTVLSFYWLEEGVRSVEERFAIQLDLATGGAPQARGGGDLSAEQRTLLGAFQAELGTWREELTLRRRLIRAAAVRRLAPEAESPPVAPRAKVGRNDACSCGSGKKFKRCCQGAGVRS